MRILITGASGFLGTALERHLAAAGHRLRLQVRRAGSFEPGDMAEVLTCPAIETLSINAWREYLEGIDAVVHTAAIAHIGADVPEERYVSVNTDASARLAEAAASLGINRFVFISSIRAQVGPSSTIIQTEQTEPAPTEPYGRSKLQAELRIRAVLPDAVHLRPALVIGNEAKGNLATMLDLADTPFPLPVASLRAGQAMIARDNLIAAIELALTNDSMRGETYVAADDPHPVLPDMLTWMREGMTRPPRIFALPEPLLRLPLALLGKSQAFDRLVNGLVVDSTKLRTAGWRPGQSPAECFRSLGRFRHGLNQARKEA